MSSVFSQIIAGELPAEFVWSDDACVALMSINPLRPGHTLVVPRLEVEQWLDLDPGLWGHLTGVAKEVGAGIGDAYRPAAVGLMLAGLEVPHVHLHLVPIEHTRDMDFAGADPDPGEAALSEAAGRIRDALRGRGATQVAGE